jgi:hypothetical protein
MLTNIWEPPLSTTPLRKEYMLHKLVFFMSNLKRILSVGLVLKYMRKRRRRWVMHFVRLMEIGLDSRWI